MIQNPGHEVVLGGLELIADGQPVWHDGGFRTNVLGEDTQWGNPQPVTTTLLSMLAAGSLVSRNGDDNREASLRVEVHCDIDNGDALAAAEAALMAVCNRPTTLEWLPPQMDAARAVFDVVDSSLEHVMDDLDELRITRTYRIRINALPYARSAELTISPAVPVVASTVVDDGTSTANWAATRPAFATVSVVSGAVTATYNPSSYGGGFYGTNLKRLFPITFDATVNRYIAVDWKSSVPSYHGFRVNAGYGDLAEIRRDPLSAGYVRSYYQIPASVQTVVSADFGIIHNAQPSGSATLSIDQIQVMQALPVIGSGRQMLRTIEVGGSAPTQGTIQVTHPTTGLGETIVYSYESQGGYQPVLSPWRTAAGTFTADASTLAGGFWELETTHRWSIPVTALPSGEAYLVMRIHNSQVGTCSFDWSAFSEMGGAVLGVIEDSFTHDFPVAFEQHFVVLPVPLNLPTIPMGPSGKVSLDLRRLSTEGPGVSYIHDAWIFSAAGSLSIVSTGGWKRLEVRAPSIDEPQGSMWAGDSADGSDWYSVSNHAVSRQHHTLKPGTNNVLTVTVGAVNAEVSAKHFDRHHTHPKSA